MNTELAWAAGFFDGEGTICLHTAKWNGVKGEVTYPCLKVSVCQSGSFALELLTRFQNAVGVGRIYGPRVYKNNLPRWDWNACGFEESQNAIVALWKYLGPYKRDQAKKTLTTISKFYKSFVPPHPRGGAGHRHKAV